MNIIDKIKEHWKTILTILFAVLYIGSCTSNCSHKNEIRLMKDEMNAQTEIIQILSNKADSLDIELTKRDIVISEKQKNVESLERTAKRNIVNVVKIDTTKRK